MFINLFLTPVNDWIHNCNREWTQKWDLALMISTVWPNRRQGIISVLSGGAEGQFHKPNRGKKTKVEKPSLKPKVEVLSFPLSLYLGDYSLTVFLF